MGKKYANGFELADDLVTFMGKDAWSKFIDNCTKEGRNLATYISSNVKSPSEVILGAFEWDKTPEGHNFWEEIHTKWKHYLKELETPTHSPAREAIDSKALLIEYLGMDRYIDWYTDMTLYYKDHEDPARRDPEYYLEEANRRYNEENDSQPLSKLIINHFSWLDSPLKAGWHDIHTGWWEFLIEQGLKYE